MFMDMWSRIGCELKTGLLQTPRRCALWFSVLPLFLVIACGRSDSGRSVSSTDAAFKAAGGMMINLGSGISMRLVEIKPGRFMMGSPLSEIFRGDDEQQYEATISRAFFLGQTEVTQAQWEAVMGRNPSRFTGDPSRPVEGVSWDDAQEFCRRLSQKTGMNFRLPTEAEWEYACRAGTMTAYSFGNDASRLGEFAWFQGNSDESTKPVGTREPNLWGLYDMHGNVWEWVEDRYGDYPSEATTDPPGRRAGPTRGVRGGSWNYHAPLCRAAFRHNLVPTHRSDFVGFRVARTP